MSKMVVVVVTATCLVAALSPEHFAGRWIVLVEGRQASRGAIDLLRTPIVVVDGHAKMVTVKQATKAGN